MGREIFIVTLNNNDPKFIGIREIKFLTTNLGGAWKFIDHLEQRKSFSGEKTFASDGAGDAFRQALRISFTHAWRKTSGSLENSLNDFYDVNVEISKIWEASDEEVEKMISFDRREDGTKPSSSAVLDYVHKWHKAHCDEPPEELTNEELKFSQSL